MTPKSSGANLKAKRQRIPIKQSCQYCQQPFENVEKIKFCSLYCEEKNDNLSYLERWKSKDTNELRKQHAKRNRRVNQALGWSVIEYSDPKKKSKDCRGK